MIRGLDTFYGGVLSIATRNPTSESRQESVRAKCSDSRGVDEFRPTVLGDRTVLIHSSDGEASSVLEVAVDGNCLPVRSARDAPRIAGYQVRGTS